MVALEELGKKGEIEDHFLTGWVLPGVGEPRWLLLSLLKVPLRRDNSGTSVRGRGCTCGLKIHEH